GSKFISIRSMTSAAPTAFPPMHMEFSGIRDIPKQMDIAEQRVELEGINRRSMPCGTQMEKLRIKDISSGWPSLLKASVFLTGPSSCGARFSDEVSPEP